MWGDVAFWQLGGHRDDCWFSSLHGVGMNGAAVSEMGFRLASAVGTRLGKDELQNEVRFATHAEAIWEPRMGVLDDNVQVFLTLVMTLFVFKLQLSRHASREALFFRLFLPLCVFNLHRHA